MDCSMKAAKQYWQKSQGVHHAVLFEKLNKNIQTLDGDLAFEERFKKFLPEIYSLYTMNYPKFRSSDLLKSMVEFSNQMNMMRVMLLLHLSDKILYNVSKELVCYAEKHLEDQDMEIFLERLHDLERITTLLEAEAKYGVSFT